MTDNGVGGTYDGGKWPAQEKAELAAAQKKPEPEIIHKLPEEEARRALADGGWKCSCGRINYRYITTCPCGKNKRDFVQKA